MNQIERLRAIQEEVFNCECKIRDYKAWLTNPDLHDAGRLAFAESEIKVLKRKIRSLKKEKLHIRQLSLFTFDKVEVRQPDLI